MISEKSHFFGFEGLGFTVEKERKEEKKKKKKKKKKKEEGRREEEENPGLELLYGFVG